MADLVPAEDIERIVGIDRHPTDHYGHTVSSTGILYVLHSQVCRDSGASLLDCPFTAALDRGINMEAWLDKQDEPVVLRIYEGRLIPQRASETVHLL